MCNFLFFLWTKCSLPLRKNGKDLENYLPMGVLLGWECCPFWIARDWILRKYWALIRSGKGMLIVMALWNFRLKKRKIDKEVSRKHSSKSELCFLILLCLKMSLKKACMRKIWNISGQFQIKIFPLSNTKIFQTSCL